jgi:signal transduction histidine kinase
MLEIIVPKIKIEPESLNIDDKPIVQEIMEYLDSMSHETQTPCGDETTISECEEDGTVELTDISPEELIEQEEEEKRIRDELALIQLTKLTKKRVRTKK